MVNPSSLASAAGAAVTALAGGDAAAGGIASALTTGVAEAQLRAARASTSATRSSSAPRSAATTTPPKSSTRTQLGAAATARPPAAVGIASQPRVNVPGWATTFGPVRAPAPRATSATSTTRTSASTSTTASSSSSLSFLSDPKLSIEEKLVRLLSHLNDKWEKEMKAKMDEIAAGEKKTSSTSSSSKTTSTKKKSLLGSIASAVTGAVPGLDAVLGAMNLPGVKSFLGKISGPALAAGASALGFGAAAPLLLKYGSTIVDAAAGVAKTTASSTTSSSASSTGTGDATLSDAKRQELVMEIQRLYEKQKEMFGLVSGILRTGHETRMGVINNIR